MTWLYARGSLEYSWMPARRFPSRCGTSAQQNRVSQLKPKLILEALLYPWNSQQDKTNHFMAFDLQVLRFLGAQINYGGRVTDANDKRLIDVIADTYVNERLIIEVMLRFTLQS